MAATKAIAVLERQKIAFETFTYDYVAGVDNIGLFAAESLGISPHILLKTLMVDTPLGPAIALVSCDRQLDLKAFAKVLGTKKCTLMAKDVAQRLSGYVIGGISPLGQKKRLNIYVDASVRTEPFVVFNGGQRGLQIQLHPDDLIKVGNGQFAELS